MKIRTGFVSNSSSSSFVVQLRKYGANDKLLLNENQIKGLLDFGFHYSITTSPISVEFGGSWESDELTSSYALAISVLTNESDIAQFLINHNIPFIGLCHYGHYSIIWKGKKEKIHYILNPGLSCSTYNDLDLKDFIGDGKIFKEYTVEEWRKEFSWNPREGVE